MNENENTHLRHISIKDFKSIKRVDLEMKPINILIGSNGSDKTNFISAFNFLRNLSVETIQQISDEVGVNKSQLVCCSAFRCSPTRFTNLTIKKTPKMVLSRCEWAHDDYSLNVENLLQMEQELEQQDLLGGYQ